MSKKDKKRIAELEDENIKQRFKIATLVDDIRRNEVELNCVRNQRDETYEKLQECYRREEKLKEKYARLLERYIKFMEEVADNERRETD